MTEVIRTGGEVDIEGRDRTILADRIELLDSGMVKLVNKKQYGRTYYPRERIERIATHTDPETEEGAAWW